jgi:hypothetical protein
MTVHHIGQLTLCLAGRSILNNKLEMQSVRVRPGVLLPFLLASALAFLCIVPRIGWLGVVLHFQEAETAS